jgi:hypothetical protein
LPSFPIISGRQQVRRRLPSLLHACRCAFATRKNTLDTRFAPWTDIVPLAVISNISRTQLPRKVNSSIICGPCSSVPMTHEISQSWHSRRIPHVTSCLIPPRRLTRRRMTSLNTARCTFSWRIRRRSRGILHAGYT